jgi:hypothetical protein
MTINSGPNDVLDYLQAGFKKDGTHPDFPERIVFRLEDWGKIPWSDLAFDLPALAVYSQGGETDRFIVGMVIALSHWVGGTRIMVRSKHNGETICHPIDESPEGLRPDYLLIKKHLPMAGIP